MRGDKYEVLLSKLSYLQEKSFLSTASPFQLVAMSATISQTERLTSWLHADMFNCDHRPIQLTHLLKDRCGIYNQEFKLVETLPSASNHSLDDSLHVR